MKKLELPESAEGPKKSIKAFISLITQGSVLQRRPYLFVET